MSLSSTFVRSSSCGLVLVLVLVLVLAPAPALLVACGGKATAVDGNASAPGAGDTPSASASDSAPSPPSTPPATGADAAPPPASGPGFPTSPCGDPGTGLAGTSYDVTRSRFAFGSTPTQQTADGMTRWTGTDGALVIGAFGNTTAGINAGAPEGALPDWSEDPGLLTTHVRDYWIAMGVPACQILAAQVTALIGSDGSHQRSIVLSRALDGIPIPESHAFARFDDADQSTSEGFLFPAIPPDVVAAARSFRDQLATPAGLAAYKAKLPADSQGAGDLVIHHSVVSFMPGTPFVCAATWEVTVGGVTRSYDANGAAVTTQF